MLKLHRPLRVAVLCSRGAPGLLHLLHQSPGRGADFEIVCCVTSEQTFAEAIGVARHGVPVYAHPIAEFYAARAGASRRDLAVREAYDAETLTLIEGSLPDILLLDGYLYLVTAPLLNRFRHRVLNLHFADLRLRAPDGGPLFPGIRAVRAALAAGAEETRATVHLVDAQLDAGPPLVCSWPYPVAPLVEELHGFGVCDAFKAYAFAHEQWMMRTASGPLVAAALHLVASGAIDLDAMPGAPDRAMPWLLDRRGLMMAPDGELAAARDARRAGVR